MLIITREELNEMMRIVKEIYEKVQKEKRVKLSKMNDNDFILYTGCYD